MLITNLPKLTGYSELSVNRGTRPILQVGETDKMPTCKNVFSAFLADRKIHSSLSSESLYG
jgi:hypothetical protein